MNPLPTPTDIPLWSELTLHDYDTMPLLDVAAAFIRKVASMLPSKESE